jgi:hypothetical protein
MSAKLIEPSVPATASPSPTGERSAAERPRGRPPRPKGPASGPSREAKQRAAVILEVLAGSRTPSQAAAALAVSVSRYYLLEATALQGLLAACEPAPRGPGSDLHRQAEQLRAECARWQRECARQQALVRAAQRAIGLTAPAAAPAKDGGKRRRQRKPVARALKVVARLQQEAPPVSEGSAGPGTEG